MRPNLTEIVVENADGQEKCKVEPWLADMMVANGEALSIRGKKIRLKEAGADSRYKTPDAALNSSDAEALAGAIPMTRARRERIAAWRP